MFSFGFIRHGEHMAMTPAEMILVFELIMPGGWLIGAAELAAQRFAPSPEERSDRLIAGTAPLWG